MNNILLNVLYQAEDHWYTDVIRWFFATILKGLFAFISKLYDFIIELASFDFGANAKSEAFYNNIFDVLIIFMIFRLTITMLNYIVNPDSFTDKSVGMQNVIKRILISIFLLISINPIFSLLRDLQAEILNNDVINSMVLGGISDDVYEDNNGTVKLYKTKMADICEDRYLVTVSTGDHLSVLILRPFYQPYKSSAVSDYDELKSELREDGYCGTDVFNENGSYVYGSSLPGDNDTTDLLDRWGDLTGNDGNVSNKNCYEIDFNFFGALIAAIFAGLLLISLSFDIVVRSLTLLAYQMFAPIPIISYISPKGKMSEMLKNWGSAVGRVWASLFIKLFALNFAVYIMGVVCDEIDLSELGLVTSIVVVIGCLIFAKKLPKILEDVIPGLKVGGMELNPLKKIKNDALFGKNITGTAGAVGRMGLDAVGQGASNLYAFGRNKHNLKKEIKLEEAKGDNADQEKINKLKNRYDYMNAGRAISTTVGGIVGGARRGVVSGYKIGESGSANIFKDLKSDIKKGNTARNNRQNINDYNRELKRQLDEGNITSEEYKEQKYGFIERNVTERLDRNAGIKNEYGGYGLYNKRIEDLNRKIENLKQQEESFRTGLATACATKGINQREMEKIFDEVNNNGKKLGEVLESMIPGTDKASIAMRGKLASDYNSVESMIGNIRQSDNEQKALKAERNNIKDMMEAREAVKNDK